MKIIGLTGLAGSGKDSVAALLRMHGYKRYAFGDLLRQEVEGILRAGIFPADDWLRGMAVPSDEVREIRQHPRETVWAKPLPPTMRIILQHHGTEVRRAQDPNYWVKQLIGVLKAEEPAFAIVTDVRFQNEAEAIRNLGGQVWRVLRPGTSAMSHVSEAGQVAIDADHTLANDGTLYDLAGRVLECMEEMK